MITLAGSMKATRIFAALAAAALLFACQKTDEDVYPIIHKDTAGSETSDGETLAATKAGQNAVYVSAGTLNLKNASVRKSGDAGSLGTGANAAVYVTGTGWLISNKSSVVSSADYAPALTVAGGKAEGAVKLTDTILSTTGSGSPAIFISENSILMDTGQLSTTGSSAAIYVPEGATASVELNGVLCSSDVLAEVYGTLNLKLGQYAGSETSYIGAIKNNGTVILEDPDNIWKGAASGSGTLNKR